MARTSPIVRSRVRGFALRATMLVALTATALGGCGASAGTATPGGPPATIQQALAMVPASITQVEIVDQAAAKKRWGLADLTGSAWTDKSQSDKFKEFTQHSQNSAMFLQLQSNLATMDDWGWNALDVDWEVRYLPKDKPPVTIDKLRDDLDMKVVTKSFADHGFKQTGSGDELRFDGALGNVGGTAFLRGVTVIPSRHLLIMARPEAATLPAADSSLAGNETVKQLTSELSPADYLALSVGPDACVSPIDTLGGRATPELIKKVTAELGTLGAIGGAAAAVLDDGHSRVRTSYPDDTAATKDLPARQKLLADGTSVVSQQPYANLLPGTVKADGKFLQYDLTPQRSAQIMQMFVQSDTPWAFCT